MRKPTRIIGIAGGSGSGKTTLARALARHLGHARILAQDSYYIDQSHRFDGDGGSVNFDHPESIDFPLLARHLEALRNGHTVEVPIYDFATHSRSKKTERFIPAELVIVEGTLLFSQPEILKQLDLSVFVDARESVRFSRRLHRDTTERGRTPDGVRKQFERQVKPMHDEFVEPSREQADLVVNGEASLDEELKTVLQRLADLS
jgi:uridine kinase